MDLRLPGTWLILLLTACQPTFKGKGLLTVEGAAFVPATCHVMASKGGIELTEAGGRRLELVIPPRRVDAWVSFTEVPHVAVAPPGGLALVDLGACGSLTLKGEGWHGDGKRAVSGTLSLSCGGGSTAGSLEFSGCF